ncbi:hypothetical protein CLOM_g8183 [Closterium sp. NIES-68]|nr:hypothetical protein CLOM_g8183 [Closterium sp. NIES-68]GJP79355.1 hypothetical protein CLOP_g9597 [Closterium sp. NIES-67]
MQPDFDSRSPSPSLPTGSQDVPILVSRYHHEITTADDDDHTNNGAAIVFSARTAVDRSRSDDLRATSNGVQLHWSESEALQLVRAFVEVERDTDLKRSIHGNYYRELLFLLLHKHPDFRHSQAALKSKLQRMKDKYYRLQDRLERSAVTRTDPLPEWYVLLDTVMKKDARNWREAIPIGSSRENRSRSNRQDSGRGSASKSRGHIRAALAAREERTQGNSTGHALAHLNDTPAYAFPALPSLPTAAAAGPNALQCVRPAPSAARESSVLYAPSAAAVTAPSKSAVASSVAEMSTTPAQAAAAAAETVPALSTAAAVAPAALAGRSTHLRTLPAPSGATALAADGAGARYLQSLRAATPASGVVAPSAPPAATAVAAVAADGSGARYLQSLRAATPASGVVAPSAPPASPAVAAVAADGSGASYVQLLRAATLPNSARGDRLTPPSSAQNGRRSLSPSARDDLRMSPPSAARDETLVSPPPARYNRRMLPSFAQQGRRVSAPGGFAGWRGSRQGGWAWRRERNTLAADPEAGSADHMADGNADYRAAADSLGAAMDEAVESAFTDFQGMAQEWVESACAEFEGLVGEMAEKACFQFRSAGREFAEAWRAGQENKRRRRY